MSALSLLRDWRRQVQDELLPGLHGHQSKALADMSFAMTIADHCWAGKLAVAVPGDARPASVERRLERTLANDRIDPASVWPQLARAILSGWAGGPIVLILDETPNHNDLRCMKLTLAYHKRALPVACACYALGGQPEPMPALIAGLFRRVAACLPAGAEVTLLADRGLCWPQVSPPPPVAGPRRARPGRRSRRVRPRRRRSTPTSRSFRPASSTRPWSIRRTKRARSPSTRR